MIGVALNRHKVIRRRNRYVVTQYTAPKASIWRRARRPSIDGNSRTEVVGARRNRTNRLRAASYAAIGGLVGAAVVVIALVGLYGAGARPSAAILALVFLFTVLWIALFVWSQRRLAIPLRTKKRRPADLAHMARLALAGEISASIVHEVTQPLSAILLDIEAMELLLQKRGGDLGGVEAIVKDLKREQHRANAIIQQVRNLLAARELQLENTDVNELIQSILALLEVDLRKRNVVVRTHLDATLSPVAADPVHLQQALLNLIVNAMDAMTETTQAARLLEVSTNGLQGRQAEVIVSDNGAGMSREQLRHAFDKFFTTKKAGMGLGLSITRSIVLAHRGTIWIEPRRGGGTSFHFTMPFSPDRERRNRSAGSNVTH